MKFFIVGWPVPVIGDQRCRRRCCSSTHEYVASPSKPLERVRAARTEEQIRTGTGVSKTRTQTGTEKSWAIFIQCARCLRVNPLSCCRWGSRRRSLKPTEHQSLCDLCRPTARGSESGEQTLLHCVGHQDHPGYTCGTRWAGAALVPAQRWTIRGCKEGRQGYSS